MKSIPPFYALALLCFGLLPMRVQAGPLDQWTVRLRNPTPWTNNPLRAIAYGNNQFVAVGDTSAVVTSPDGMTWTSRTSGTGNDLSGIAYGNNTFVAVGAAGTSLQSGVLAPTQPALGPVVLLPGGAVQVTLTGLPGQTYLIQASTNLTDWLTITNVALTTPSGQFLDTSATNFSRRFYRAVGQ